MPNGGSDMCGTCPFNRKNRGQAGYGGVNNPEPDHCDIRDLAIKNSFFTYCSNHPYHNPDRLRSPIGPVFRWDGSDGVASHPRVVWVPAPDSEEIRGEMLRLLSVATPDSERKYHGGFSITEASMRQFGEWQDTRAIPGLDRVRGFVYPPPPQPEPGDEEDEEEPEDRTPRLTALAEAALRKIVPPDSLTPFRTEAVTSLAAGVKSGNHYDRLPILADALEEAGYAGTEVLHYLRNNCSSPNWVVDVLTGEIR